MSSTPQSYKVYSGGFKKTLAIPTSKSYANRLLILASLFPGPITIKSAPSATDVVNLLLCLKKIGLEIIEDSKGLTVLNSFPSCENTGQEIILETGDGGTTNRFLMALLARGQNTYTLRPDPLFLKRPIDDFLAGLRDLGVKVEKTPTSIKIQGPINLNRKSLIIDSKYSSQFASALSLALADKDIEIIAKNLDNSQKYFLLTKDLIGKISKGEKEFEVPLDFSSLSYPAALAAVSGELEVENYWGRDPNQADLAFLDILGEIGVFVEEEKGRLKIRKSPNLRPLEIDCSGFLDLVPTLSFLFSCIPGKSVLKNLKGLRFKESDRIFEIQKILNLFGIKNTLFEDSNLEIIGTDRKHPAVKYYPPKDHRMIMTAYLFMRFNNGGLIHDHYAVNKSFPGFFELLSIRGYD